MVPESVTYRCDAMVPKHPYVVTAGYLMQITQPVTQLSSANHLRTVLSFGLLCSIMWFDTNVFDYISVPSSSIMLSKLDP